MSHKRNITSPKDEMRTPPELFKKLNDRFHFDIDLAAAAENTLCEKYFSRDSFSFLDPMVHCPIGSTCYCNPPYNRTDLPAFVKKCYDESQMQKCTIAMLLPVDFSTNWWDCCMKASEWLRIKGRVHFLDNAGTRLSSPFFDSVVVVFRPSIEFATHGMKVVEQDGLVVSEL